MTPQKLGRYEVVRQVGRGGFGLIYQAHDPSVNRTVALKVLSAGGDPHLLERFRTEAAAAGNLRHPNIVTIYELGRDGDTAFIAMEFIDGLDLERSIASGRVFTPLQALELMLQVARALRHAHENGVLHRDIKPSNIMLSSAGEAKVTDFGIARLMENASRLTQAGYLIGTIRYMAPEQFNDQPYTFASEVWSFGLVCYEILTGRHPFQESEGMSAMARITTQDIGPVTDLRPDVPPEISQLIGSMLRRNPDERLQSFDDVIVEIESVLPALRQAGVTDLQMQAEQFIREGHFAEAEAVIRRILEYNPNHADARRWREELRRRQNAQPELDRAFAAAEQAAQAGQFTEAIQQLERVRSLHPTNPQIPKRIASLQQRAQAARPAALPPLATEMFAPQVPQAVPTPLPAAPLDTKPLFQQDPVTPARSSASWMVPGALAAFVVSGVLGYFALSSPSEPDATPRQPVVTPAIPPPPVVERPKVTPPEKKAEIKAVIAKPSITRFDLDPLTVRTGTVTAEWRTSGTINAVSLSLYSGGTVLLSKNDVTGTNYYAIQPTVLALPVGEHAVELEVSGPGGRTSLRRSFTVQAPPPPRTNPPKILSFEPSALEVGPGDSVELKWTTSAAAKTSLEYAGRKREIVNNRSSFKLGFSRGLTSPASVTLVVENADGEDRRTLVIQPKAVAGFRILTFRVEPQTARIDQMVHFRWTLEGQPDELRLTLAGIPKGSRAQLDASVKGRQSYSLELAPQTFTRVGQYRFTLTGTFAGKDDVHQVIIKVEE